MNTTKIEIVVPSLPSLPPTEKARNERMVWCDNNIGIDNVDWDCSVDKRGVVYTFYKEEDAVLFSLKWL